MTDATTKTASAARKPGGKGGRGRGAGPKTANPFAKLAGGAASEAVEAAAETVADNAGGGITAGIAAATIDGHPVRRINPRVVAPHPFNDPARSAPQPGNAKWTELVDGVRRWGVKVPCLVVTRAAFVLARPELADLIDEAIEFVLIYGHRRTAAAIEAGVANVPAVIDDSVLDNGGDLDLMTLENLGREDLSPLAEARQYARYSEIYGLTGRQIGERLGVNQATVSRRLSLLLLTDENQQAVEDGKIPVQAAAALGSKLPYGPRRTWQKSADPASETDERRADQNEAAQEIIDEDGSGDVDRIVDRIKKTRESLTKAAADGLDLVDDPYKKWGPSAYAHRLREEAAVEAARAQGTLVASVDQYSGELLHYTTEAPAKDTKAAKTDRQQAEAAAAKHRQEAMKARRAACVQALRRGVPARETMYDLLSLQVAYDMSNYGTSSEGWSNAQKWSFEANTGPTAGTKDEYREAAARITDPKKRAEVVYACLLAGFEIQAASTWRPWNRAEVAYLDLLASRADYKPTEWERERLEDARRRIAADDAPSDDEAAAILEGQAEPADEPGEVKQDKAVADTEDSTAEDTATA